MTQLASVLYPIGKETAVTREGATAINIEIYLVLSTICLLTLCALASAQSGGNADVAAFGMPLHMLGEKSKPVFCPALTDADPRTSVEVEAGQVLQIEWQQPRDVFEVVVKGERLPKASEVEVQWWHRIWPDNGRGGWMRLDDPFNGEWRAATAEVQAAKDGLAYRFAPLTTDEVAGIKNAGAAYRHTYKIRLVFKAAASVSAVETYTHSTWKTAEIKLEWKPKAGKPVQWKGKIEARNGCLESVRGGAKAGEPVVVNVRYADSPDRLSEDRGYVVFRAPGWDSFSVFVDDLIREGGIYVRDIDAFVSDASKNLSYSNWKGPKDKWDATVMGRIAKTPEQNMERVSKAVPDKAPREAYLGVANMRQEFGIWANGNIELPHNSLRGPGPDTDRRTWKQHELRYAFATGEKPSFDYGTNADARRWLEEGWLPVIRTEWTTDAIKYERAAISTMLMEAIDHNEDARRGDEPLVLLDKIEMTNTSAKEQTAYVWMELSLKVPMSIDKDGLLVMETASDGAARPGLTATRGRFDINGKGELTYLPSYEPAQPGSPDPDIAEGKGPRPVVRYAVKLAPGEKHTLYFNVTYVELLEEREVAALKSFNFDDKYAEVVAYWKKRDAEGMQYEVPEPILNNLFRANLWHVLMTTDKDPETGLHQHGAATCVYRIYANETGMVAESMQMRGEHAEALRMEEPFIVGQGYKPLPGNFKSKEGLFYSAYPTAEKDPYTAQGYNMHHGWALWNLAEHYLWTRDAEWLKNLAPRLVAGCDWITRERKGTKVKLADGSKPVEWGLAPAGDLEDVEEYLYFYATNAYYYMGLRTAAQALAEIKHPDAARLAKDAEAYKKDILESLKESTATCPVVKLRDGTWVPYVPQRTHALTHLKEGWIREGLYPAVHLIDCELLEPNHPLMTWLLEDMEDNIFLSEESGYKVDDFEKQFFDYGGFNCQPNLCPNTQAHLRRDEIPHFLRVFYNECWASIYTDTVCFAEWVRRHGQGGGPLYKTPDECKFIQYMRNMLVWEEGDTLRLGTCVPRAWMTDGKSIRIQRAATYFGPMDMTITSHVGEGFISAKVSLPTRNPAKAVVLRLRHPEGKPMKSVTIDGKPWDRFDASRELITLPEKMKAGEVVARY